MGLKIKTADGWRDAVEVRYHTPLVLDGTGDTVTWDYAESDTAQVTLTDDKALVITNGFNGAVAVVACYGAQLDFSDTEAYVKSVSFGYLEPLEGEHIVYTLYCMGGKWHVSSLVYAGGAADE